MMTISRFETQESRGHDYHEDCWTVIITVIILVTLVINIIIIIIVVIAISFYTSIFYTTHLKCGVREHWCCRGCVVMIIIMTTGDAEDAS